MSSLARMGVTGFQLLQDISLLLHRQLRLYHHVPQNLKIGCGDTARLLILYLPAQPISCKRMDVIGSQSLQEIPYIFHLQLYLRMSHRIFKLGVDYTGSCTAICITLVQSKPCLPWKLADKHFLYLH
jgi:hypothetical protein